MKMKDLERKTGVSRETIRYYIREGLVPEPERPKKNVARYDEAHITAIMSIKQLQKERDLPLEVIKPLLHAQSRKALLRKDAFPGLADALEALLETDGSRDDLSFELASEYTGLDVEALEGLRASGAMEAHKDAAGNHILPPTSVEIARHWAALRQAGYHRGDGFGEQTAALYADFIGWLADQEIKQFHDNLAGQLEPSEAAQIARAGVIHVNDMLALMRTQALLKRLRDIEPEELQKLKKTKEKKT